MKATFLKPVTLNISVKEITLLSIEEAHKAGELDVLSSLESYWLRSPGEKKDAAAYVWSYGVDKSGWVVCMNLGIRPALRISYPKAAHFKPGDEIQIAGYGWTFITDELVLCNKVVDIDCFREDAKAEDANDYEKSDVKVWLHDWAKENGIVLTKGK